MLSKKRQKQIQDVVADAFYEQFRLFENNPEIMGIEEKERFDILSELNASVCSKLTNLFRTWNRRS